ncbi:M24 family metallopeptidase [Halocatena pleomorpha]|uniref:Aminopeptidase P family protein n=1 Tax=Halocatena pleomorpha TaxID=1785090 RepID=A0A3P3R5J6_9EURY|nr:Xaa-Pro peptidase family protein [Halocatena pleomorpha]RRJ28159.1 aminopeptidase P family protein [Halocatena pleomorpha]
MTPFERRTRACQQRLRDQKAEAVVLFPSRNLQYTTSVVEEPSERHLFFIVPARGEPVFVVPELYGEQLRAETWVADVRTWADSDDPLTLIKTVVEDSSIDPQNRLLVDDTMGARFTQELRSLFPAATFGLASEVLGPLRRRKDDAELDALRAAATITDEVVASLRELGSDAVGLTETELAAVIEKQLQAAGGTGVSFAPIIGSGPNGADPHHRHGDREIRAGEPVVLDFGTRADGYPSDQTRTLVFDGNPPAAVADVHEIVRNAQAAAVDAVAPGVTASAVDDAARDVIESAGYGEQFIHRTGHGVGLDVHEEPYIVADNDRTLKPGMVFSIEPGVYVPGEFGVRIEDLVVVTEDGCERLNHADRGLGCK